LKPNTDYEPFVTIAVPAFNEEKTLEGTILSAIALDYPAEKIKIIIVDDGSTDRTAEIAQKLINKNKGHRIELLHQKNSGKGSALNQALDKAEGDLFVCFDADSLIQSNALRKMVPFFTQREIGSVIPMMKAAKPGNLIQKLQWYEYLFGILLKDVYGKNDCIHVIPGPFSMFRTSLLRELNGWDDKRNLTEDFELTLRIQKRNMRILQTHETSIYTHTPHTLKKLFKQRVRWYLGSLVNMMKHKDILFNSKLGDFAFFQAPALLSLLTLTNLTFLSGFFLQFFLIKGVSFNSGSLELLVNGYVLSLTDSKIAEFTGILFTLIIFIILMYISARKSGEKMIGMGYFSFLVYLTVYWSFLSLVWFYVTFQYLFNSKSRKW
jgi:cellulose synthase/poly-beta-1,6-N-acetylglucosamine synthase-like glycosyltransferase